MSDKPEKPTLATRCHSLRSRADALCNDRLPPVGPAKEAGDLVREAACLITELAHRLEALESLAETLAEQSVLHEHSIQQLERKE